MENLPLDNTKICCVMSGSSTRPPSWLPPSFEALREAGADITVIASPTAWTPDWVQERYDITSDIRSPNLKPSENRIRVLRIIDNTMRNIVRRSTRALYTRKAHRKRLTLIGELLKKRPEVGNGRRIELLSSIYQAILACNPDIVWVLKGWYLDVALTAAQEVDARVVFEHSDLCFAENGANEKLAQWMPYEANLAAQTDSTIVCAPGYIDYYQEYAQPTSIKHMHARWLMSSDVIDTPSRVHHPLRFISFGIIHPSRYPDILIQAFERTEYPVTLTLQGENQITPEDETIYPLMQAAIKEFLPKITVLDPCKWNRVVETVSHYDVGIVVHDTLTEGRIHCLTTKVCTYLAAGLIVLSVDTPGMRAGLGESDAIIYLREPTPEGIAEGIRVIANMSDDDIMRRKQVALELAHTHSWETIGKQAYLDEFIRAKDRLGT